MCVHLLGITIQSCVCIRDLSVLYEYRNNRMLLRTNSVCVGLKHFPKEEDMLQTCPSQQRNDKINGSAKVYKLGPWTVIELISICSGPDALVGLNDEDGQEYTRVALKFCCQKKIT